MLFHTRDHTHASGQVKAHFGVVQGTNCVGAPAAWDEESNVEDVVWSG